MPDLESTVVSNAGIEVEESIAGIRKNVGAARAAGRTIGFVPTMGALHQGHISLIETAKRHCDFVVVSIFVNPTQFGPNEDFARYPRTLASDLAACAQAGANLVFTPTREQLYPNDFATFIEIDGLTTVLEGAIRPGHFRGVATVVLKLFNIVAPDLAFFGAKDFQQQLVIRRMVKDLDVPVEVVTCETVREADGLAMSSRNRYLIDEERQRATAISAALFAARERLLRGDAKLPAILLEMRTAMESAGLTVDYAIACDPSSLCELSDPQAEMVLLVAARLANVRLIDNLQVSLQSNHLEESPQDDFDSDPSENGSSS